MPQALSINRIVLLCRILLDYPRTKSRAHTQCYFIRPFKQNLPFHHVSKLCWLDAKSIQAFLEFFEFCIHQVHDVLLALRVILFILVILALR